MQQKIHMLKIDEEDSLFKNNRSFSDLHIWHVKFKQNGSWFLALIRQEFHVMPGFQFCIATVHEINRNNCFVKEFRPRDFFDDYEDALNQFKQYIIGKSGRLAFPVKKDSTESDIDDEIMIFTEHILDDNQFVIDDLDMDRIYITKNNKEYMIRMWDITEDQIEWTLYKIVKHKGGGDHVENEGEGTFYR